MAIFKTKKSVPKKEESKQLHICGEGRAERRARIAVARLAREDERLDELEQRVEAQELGVVDELLDVAVAHRGLGAPGRVQLLLAGAPARRQLVRHEGKEAEEARGLARLGRARRRLPGQRDAARRRHVVLALDERRGQQARLVQLRHELQHVPPAVAHNVAVRVRQLEDGAARQLRLVVAAEADRQLVAILNGGLHSLGERCRPV